MLKLHGAAPSNYYRLAKAALVEKGLAFEEVLQPPSQDDAYLIRSPMGRIPCLETDEGFLSESFAIITYLEGLQPEPALLPADPFARAKALELARHLELNVELVARRCIGELIFKQPVSEEIKTLTRIDLARGLAAVDRLASCSPYALGAAFSVADLYAYYTFVLAAPIVAKALEQELLASYPRLQALMTELAAYPSIQQVEARSG